MIYLDPILAPEPADQLRVEDRMDDDERVTFGANVKAARKAQCLTQEQLSERVGIKQGYLSRIEGGKADMTFEVMTRVAKALGSDVHKLLRP
ncbi:helix-turn-helix domain-containing protein [Paeniroseomonas aquatica]|uniref:helix-turn-helix domain-containing protein n=1 Tax=Paeniroseomonas aquatica TaxID=373043 RepID=UPI00338E9E1D